MKHSPDQKHNEKEQDDLTTADQRRRNILAGGSLLAAASMLWKPSKAHANRGRGSSLVVDVACLGHTMALDTASALPPGFIPPNEMRGASFYVEGAMYPQGVIPAGQNGFDPAEHTDSMIGHWLCRGWLMNDANRPNPHGITTQEYLFGLIDASDPAPSPEDTLVSSGTEGGGMLFTRAVVGGSGQYKHARGQVVQETLGRNATILNVLGVPAPSFRFYFDF